jgi:hypothetical protein
MGSSKATYFLLAVCLLAAVGAASCKLPDSQATTEQGKSDGSSRRVLSKEEIITAANVAARRHGRHPARCVIVYDEGNVDWRRKVIRLSPSRWENGREVWPEENFELNMQNRPELKRLKSHDYQVVSYWSRIEEGAIDEGTWVAVDRNTGEVLLVF